MHHRRLVDHQPQIAAFAGPASDGVGTATGATTGAATSPQVPLGLAAELLDVLDTGQAEAWLVQLIDRTRPGIAQPASRALGRLLAPVARRLLAGPAGAAHGQATPALAGRVFGLELEGLSPEDQAFELARQFVRYARAAAQQAARLPLGTTAHDRAWRAATAASRRLAPGLLPWLGGTAHTVHTARTADLAEGRRGGPRTAFDSPPGRDGAPEPFHPSKELVMHDIDRTQMEFGSEVPGFEAEQYEYAEGEWGQEGGALLSEADEFELASELLGVASEDELDQFLGGLIKKVARGAGKLIRSPIGQAVGGVLKGVAKKALPLAGGALGGMVGGPLGAKIGSGLASAAGGALGLEAEAMSQEDQEFEGAKQFVRLAADTVAKAASAAPSADPRAVAQAAAVSAARQLAPGLLKSAGSALGQGGAGGRGQAGQGGRWARRGNTIVLYGA
ncbi:hypothetical protein [Ideonella sp. A 288]|uniref:hypothetical protein n=1 Tax=Ideonella sp. A 288 TaxID=1962181 RepID=UPI0018FE10FB|nr:hypothetical protein [Ideonella sp. A 288]